MELKIEINEWFLHAILRLFAGTHCQRGGTHTALRTNRHRTYISTPVFIYYYIVNAVARFASAANAAAVEFTTVDYYYIIIVICIIYRSALM